MDRHSDYSYRGYLPVIKQLITDMAVNGSGIGDTARVLKISLTTVIEEFLQLKALLQPFGSKHLYTEAKGFAARCAVQQTA